jgi:hypothetical protein
VRALPRGQVGRGDDAAGAIKERDAMNIVVKDLTVRFGQLKGGTVYRPVNKEGKPMHDRFLMKLQKHRSNGYSEVDAIYMDNGELVSQYETDLVVPYDGELVVIPKLPDLVVAKVV